MLFEIAVFKICIRGDRPNSKPPTRTQPPRVPYLSIPFVTLSLSIPSMFLTSPHDNADPSLAELLAFSARVVARKRVVRRQGVGPSPVVRLPDGDVALERVELESRFAPLPELPIVLPAETPTLAPLRDRDLKALEDWFAVKNLDEIEADVLANLAMLLPAPCWEDDPFGADAEALDFLAEYL